MAREQERRGAAGRALELLRAQLGLVSTSIRPQYRFDPRTRPWYAEAVQTKAQILTAPYVFTTHEMGVTPEPTQRRAARCWDWMWH